jgi:hypothetical protein
MTKRANMVDRALRRSMIATPIARQSGRSTNPLWSLDIGASLELGIWDLELSAVIAFFN